MKTNPPSNDCPHTNRYEWRDSTAAGLQSRCTDCGWFVGWITQNRKDDKKKAGADPA